MSAFSRASRKFRLPQYSLDSSVTLALPSEEFSSDIYRATLPHPPTGRLDAQGLRRRIEYGEAVGAMNQHRRNISPRLMNFINMVKENCKKVLTMRSGKEKREALKMLEIEDGMLQSRYEEVHGVDGLCAALMDSVHAMMEIRFRIEYGDYLAYRLSHLKESRMQDLLWKREHLDWQEVAKKIREEKKAEEKWLDRRIGPRVTVELWKEPHPPSPVLDDVAEAARMLHLSEEQIVYEIFQYATRNEYCHSGVKKLIDTCEWSELAEQIAHDKAALNAMYQERPRDQLNMRDAIVRVQEEFFTYCFYERDKVVYAINESARKKQQDRAERIAAKMDARD